MDELKIHGESKEQFENEELVEVFLGEELDMGKTVSEKAKKELNAASSKARAAKAKQGKNGNKGRKKKKDQLTANHPRETKKFGKMENHMSAALMDLGFDTHVQEEVDVLTRGENLLRIFAYLRILVNVELLPDSHESPGFYENQELFKSFLMQAFSNLPDGKRFDLDSSHYNQMYQVIQTEKDVIIDGTLVENVNGVQWERWFSLGDQEFKDQFKTAFHFPELVKYLVYKIMTENPSCSGKIIWNLLLVDAELNRNPWVKSEVKSQLVRNVTGNLQSMVVQG